MTSRPARTVRRAEPMMGTVFSFAVRTAGDASALLDDTVAWLRWVDAAFSPFRADSWLGRLDRGEVGVDECPAAVRSVLAECRRFVELTNGYFSMTPNGSLDLCGFVKGWAVETASARLADRGADDHAINGGGDVRVRAPATSPPWRVGVVDPLAPTRLAAVLVGSDLAVATSGTAERGAHIVDPTTGRRPTHLASLTVVGPDLGTADALATSGIAMGPSSRRWLESLPDYEAFGVEQSGPSWRTSGFDHYTDREPLGHGAPRAEYPDGGA